MTFIPPQATGIEKALIGAVLLNYGTNEIIQNVSPDDFYDPTNKIIYEAIQRVIQKNKTCDLMTVEAELENVGKLEQVTFTYLCDLTQMPSNNIESHVSILKDKSIRRKSIETVNGIVNRLYDESSDLIGISGDMSMVSDDMINGLFNEHTFLSVNDIIKRDMNSSTPPRLNYGQDFTVEQKKLDNFLFLDNGGYRGEVISILADSSHGKTQLMMYLAGLLGVTYKGAICQLEGRDSKSAMYLALNRPESVDNVFVRSGITVLEDIEGELRSISRNEGLDFFCIDYIQLVELAKPTGNDASDLKRICARLMNLAIELDALCIVTSQVTIDDKKKGWDREPRMENAMWSKAIKHMSHICLSVFRPKVLEELVILGYEQDYVKGWNPEQQFHYNSVFVKMQKLRDGDIKHDRLHFLHEDNRGLILQ